jgi:hypothetical protein
VQHPFGGVRPCLQGKTKRVWDIKHSSLTETEPVQHPLESDARHRKDVVFLKQVRAYLPIVCLMCGIRPAGANALVLLWLWHWPAVHQSYC